MASTTPTVDQELAEDLLYAARHNDPEFLQESLQTLFTSHADTPKDALLRAIQDEYTGNTPMHMAAANGHIGILKTLLAFFPTPASKDNTPANLKNQSGNTPLHYAGVNGHLSVVELLVKEWAGDIGIQNAAGKSVLTEAAGAEKEDVVEWCLRNWEDVENVDGEETKDTSPDEVAEDLERVDVGEGSSTGVDGTR